MTEPTAQHPRDVCSRGGCDNCGPTMHASIKAARDQPQIPPRDTRLDTYEATVITRTLGGAFDTQQTTSGGAKPTAAWLRAMADEIDPPRSALRSGGIIRQPADPAAGRTVR